MEDKRQLYWRGGLAYSDIKQEMCDLLIAKFDAGRQVYKNYVRDTRAIDRMQTDFKNADDHLFILSACKKFGVWYSRPGNGVSHPVHMERFGIPGRTLLGSDSHTPAAGALGMLAMGAGGLEVAMAMAGEPIYLKMPKIMGVRLVGALPDWVSAKDVILEMLRHYGVDGGFGKIIEYYGRGLIIIRNTP